MSLSISNCEYLLQCFQRIINILPINQEKYVSVVEMIMREIDLLRAWKKSSNKLKKNIIIQEELNKQKAIKSAYKNNIISINRKAETPIIFDKSLILKINYYLIDTYGLIRKVNSETFRREKSKIIKFTHLLSNNIITLNEVINCYKSWRGTYSKFDSGYEIFKMDKFVIEILGLDPNIKFY